MLKPHQTRHLVILAFLFLSAVALMFVLPPLVVWRHRIFHTASNPPPPVVDEAPAPPPSPLPPGASVLGGALKSVEDFTPLHQVDREPAYLSVIEAIALAKDEGLASSCEGELAYGTYAKYAPELRGRIFKIAGEAMQEIVPVRLYLPVAGREDAYRVFLWDAGLDYGFICDLIDKPAEDLQTRDPIEVVGMFYKMVRVKNVRNRDRDYPLLVARSFRRLPPLPPTEDRLFVLKVALVVGILGTLVGAWFIFRGLARSGARTDPWRRRTLSRRPGRPGAGPAGGADAPGGSPSPPEGRLS
jgi:hypothetical protein